MKRLRRFINRLYLKLAHRENAENIIEKQPKIKTSYPADTISMEEWKTKYNVSKVSKK